MRDLAFDAAIACLVVGVVGSIVSALTVVSCTINLVPMAPGMLTTMLRLMFLAAFGGVSAMLLARHRLSACTW